MKRPLRAVSSFTASECAVLNGWRLSLTSYAWVAPAIIGLSIIAGIALRLCGFVGGAYSWFTLSAAGDDLWLPMSLAFARAVGNSPGSVHDLFFIDGVKFIYPTSSLLLYSAIDAIGIVPTYNVLNAVIWICILLIPFVIFGLCCSVLQHGDGYRLRSTDRDKYIIAISFAIASLFFYPIMIAWRLGQVQGLLDLLFVLACLFFARNRTLVAGCLIGAICLVKPQFSLFLLWAGIRQKTDFVIGQITVFACGCLLSLVLYGIDNNIQYFHVLSYLSQHGEIFWDNTSVNGFVNRLIHPDQSLIFNYHESPPFHLLTYGLTVVSFMTIVAFALLANRTSRSTGGLLDFMIAGLCFTFAAPIAWGHHYGVVMPMLTVVFIALAFRADVLHRRALLVIWGACFLLFSVDWNVTDLLAGTALTFLQSWRILGVIGLIWLLYHLQADQLISADQQGHVAALITDCPEPRIR